VSLRKTSFLGLLALLTTWLVWAAVNAVTWIVKDPVNVADHAHYIGAHAVVGLAVCGLLFLVYERLRKHLPSWPGVVAAASLCYAGGMALEYFSGKLAIATGWKESYDPPLKYLFASGGLRTGALLGLISLVYFAVDHWLQLNEQRQKAREAMALAQQAQLQMLRYQLNPHFLFNALNTIRVMVVEHPLRARNVVTQLSEFLRYSLDRREGESTVADEIAALENYLSIQRVRFEDRLQVTLRVDEPLRGFTVPCFLIHPLVENAVKYGMETSPKPLRIAVEVQAIERGIVIRVSNTGHLVDVPTAGGAGTGTGLNNVRQRLALAFPGRHAFGLFERDGCVVAEIRLSRTA
jgi:hypothetical protein